MAYLLGLEGVALLRSFTGEHDREFVLCPRALPWTPRAAPAGMQPLWPSGHRILGVDSSPDMLAHARKRVPHGAFRQGDLHQLPGGRQ